MTSLADIELQRARWSRTLLKNALDTIDRSDFARGPLAGRLHSVTVQSVILPADPEAESVAIDNDLWKWLDTQMVVDIEGRSIRLGNQKFPTAHAAAIADRYGSEKWSHYIAVHRSGSVEIGLGNRGGWERPNRDGHTVRVLNLTSIVAHIWAALKFSTAHFQRLSFAGPWQFTVGVCRTEGALLGGLAADWAEPGMLENNVGGCVERGLLWHLEIQEWPDEENQRRLAFAIGDRLEDAWGVSQRRCLAIQGDHAGHLDLRRISG